MPSNTEHPNIARRFLLTRGIWWLAALAGVLLWEQAARAQEALRSSLAGEQAAEQQKQAQTKQYYNLQMGDLKLRFQASMQVEANDNVSQTPNGTADASIRPELDMTALWPVTENNTLTLNLGGGYEEYLKTKNLDQFFLNPNSSLSFNIYAGDFLINLHSSFVYSEQQYQSVDVSGGANFNYFDDFTGMTVTWDLNNVKLVLDYDHEIYDSPSPGFAYLDRNSEIVSFRAGYELVPQTLVGLEIGGSLDNYDQQAEYTNSTTIPEFVGVTNIPTSTGTKLGGSFTDANGKPFLLPFSQPLPSGNFIGNQQSVNIGPYIQSQVTKLFRVEASGGYTMYFLGQSSFNPYPGEVQYLVTNAVTGGPLSTNLSPVTGNTLSAFYTDITVTHTVNDKFAYTLQGGHQIQNGTFSGTLDLYYVYFNPVFKFIHNVALSTPINFNYAQRGGTAAENYVYWQASVQATYRLSQKLTATTSYNLRYKNSDVPANDFVQNQLVLGLTYSF